MNKKTKILIGIICGVVLLIICCCSGFHLYKLNKVVAKLTMDINPSIQISLNYKNDVVRTEGLNADGKKILKENKLKSKKLNKVIKEITDIVIDNDYVKEDHYILINVENSKNKEEIVSIINEELKRQNHEWNIIFQEITENAKNNSLKYNISENKASYIEDIIKENNDLTFEDLKDKSINEIKEISKQKNENVDVEKNDEKEEQEEEVEKENESSNNSTLTEKPNNSSENKKPSVNKYTPPANDDRTGAWCKFFNSLPPDSNYHPETPGHINDTAIYFEEAKKYFPEDTYTGSYYASITQYTTASYCGAGIIRVENYDKTKEYTIWLDSVTLELLEPVIVTELEKPKVDEAGANVIVTNWLLENKGIDINTCSGHNFYYNIDGATRIPEWQFSCNCNGTHYAIIVSGRDGSITKWWDWTN